MNYNDELDKINEKHCATPKSQNGDLGLANKLNDSNRIMAKENVCIALLCHPRFVFGLEMFIMFFACTGNITHPKQRIEAKNLKIGTSSKFTWKCKLAN